MSLTIIAFHKDKRAIRSSEFKVNLVPDTCPICHQGIEPIKRYGWFENEKLYAIFQCPKEACRALFIAHYYETIGIGLDILDPVYKFTGCVPWEVKKKVFPGIMNIFPKFIVIYNQAKEA